MARATSSAFSSNSDPGISSIFQRPSTIFHATLMQRTAVTCPLPSSTNDLVTTSQSRSQPSWWDEEVRSLCGQFGQVRALSSLSGGFESISIWVMLVAPCRLEVPMQSDPVSPPPMTTTFLSAADMNGSSGSAPPWTRRELLRRKSIAKWMPSRSRPGTGRSRGTSQPPASTTASKLSTR